MYTSTYIINDVALSMHSLGCGGDGIHGVHRIAWNETFMLLELLKLLREKVCCMNKMSVHLEIFNRSYDQFCATDIDTSSSSRRDNAVG